MVNKYYLALILNIAFLITSSEIVSLEWGLTSDASRAQAVAFFFSNDAWQSTNYLYVVLVVSIGLHG